MKGRVIKSTGSWYQVLDDQDKIWECRLKGKFRQKGIKSTNPVAVGDWVDFEEEDTNGVISHIHERNNYIVRKSVNLSKQSHIIASNIDRAFLIITLSDPPTSTGFIDRFLVSAEAYRIPVTLVFNKIDLYNEDDLEYMEAMRTIYKSIGYDSLTCSATEGIGIEELKEALKEQVSVLSGHSGVGKSTLANAIDTDLDLRTQEVSDSHHKGQHTTTFAEMFPLKFGGFIIDTPGIKGFGMVDMTKEELTNYFPDFFAIKGDCKFHNCIHINEPACAIKTAVENNELAPHRYASYLSLIAEMNDNEHFRQGH
ncbi:MAG: ribosome biogenesis GTPase [Flavobacteriales bacterium]|jgi:ribosome biogenesis GTPase